MVGIVRIWENFFWGVPKLWSSWIKLLLFSFSAFRACQTSIWCSLSLADLAVKKRWYKEKHTHNISWNSKKRWVPRCCICFFMFFLSSRKTCFFSTLFGSVGEKIILNKKHLGQWFNRWTKNPLVQNLELFLSGFVDDFTVLQELNITKCGSQLMGPLKVTKWMFHFQDPLMMFQFDSSPLTRHSRTHPIWRFSDVWLGVEWMDISMKISSVSICYQTWQE